MSRIFAQFVDPNNVFFSAPLFWRCHTKLVYHFTRCKHRRCVTTCRVFHAVLLKSSDTGTVRIGGMCLRGRGYGNIINIYN